MEQNSTLKLIPSKYWNKSQDRYILFSTLDFLEKNIYTSDQEKLLFKSTTKYCYIAMGLNSNFDPFHSSDGSQC